MGKYIKFIKERAKTYKKVLNCLFKGKNKSQSR